jgi:hypothetical protein
MIKMNCIRETIRVSWNSHFIHSGVTMAIQLEDIQSLTDFQRNTKASIARLKKTGRAAVLTVNGQAEIVVQDAKSYQRLLTRAEEADKLVDLRRSVTEYRDGRVRSADDALKDLNARHSGNSKRG